jgi:hypothetical protein
MAGVHADLLDVRPAVDEVNHNEPGGYPVLCHDPCPPRLLVGSQFLGRKRRSVGDTRHAYLAERGARRELDRREMAEVTRPRHAHISRARPRLHDREGYPQGHGSPKLLFGQVTHARAEQIG